jgi:predicted nucleic acid-binding protein
VSLVVLDASVAAKWYLPPDDEDLVPQALNLFVKYQDGQFDFIVPDVFWAELGNVVLKAVRRKRWSQDSADLAIESIHTLDISSFGSRPLLTNALGISARWGSSLYDSLYVALASESGIDMLTADRKLFAAVGGHFPVRWLGAFSIT